jgi:hypothetical protein
LLWSKKVNQFYRDNLKAAAFFTDLSADFAAGAKSVYVPNMAEMTAHAKSTATVVTLNQLTDTKVTLTMDTWYETSFAIEDKEAGQILKQYSYMEKQMQNVAYTCAAAYEDAILALFTGFSQTVGTSAAALADSNIVRAIQYLDEARCPQDGRAFFLTPKQVWSDLSVINKFSLLVNTNGADPVLKGHIGYLYGIPVIMSERIGTVTGSEKACLAHKDAIVHASSGVRVQSNYIPQYLSTIVTADVIYGVIENRDTSGVWIKTASA